MKKVLFVVLLLAVAASAQYASEQEVVNWNKDWHAANMDTLHVKAATRTLLLTGVRPGYNGIVQPLYGDVYLQLNSLWSHWWKVIEGSPFSFSGGKRDTLFLKTAETDSSVVQVMWTSWN
jgi:hypothetical protein